MKRALLIGASNRKRLGIEADLDLMEDVLEVYGFDQILRCPRPATRRVMLSALEQFADSTGSDDIAVIYYTGHGGLARFSGPIAGRERPDRIWRYLVPEDPLHSASKDNFRGVLDVELGHAVARMAAICANVTLILECCYAGGMLAPADVQVSRRARGFEDLKSFTAPKCLQGPQAWSTVGPSRCAATGGQQPVVVAATSEARKSYESTGGPRQGYFTEALAAALWRHQGRRVGWGRLIDDVRDQVRSNRGMLDQEPHIIGPRGREVFGTATADVSREFEVVFGIDGRPCLFAGTLHALREGDRLELLDPVDNGSLGVAVIRSAGPTRSLVEIEDEDQKFEPGVALVAVLVRRAKPTPVRMIGNSPTMIELREAVRASPWLCDEGSDSELFEVSIDQGRLQVVGPHVARKPLPELPREDLAGDIDSPVPWTVADLEALARAQGFVEACAGALPPPPEIEFWLRAHGKGGERELGYQGGIIELCERVEAGMKYGGGFAGETMFVNLLNLGVDGRVQLHNANIYNSGGFDLWSEAPGEARGQTRSIALTWPSDVPEQPACESLYFVLTSARVGLETLTRHDPTPEPDDIPRSRGVLVLDRLFEPVASFVQRIEFTLQP